MNLTERTIRNYIAQGRIPAVKIKRQTYIWDKNLLQFLRGAKTTRKYEKVVSPEYESLEYDKCP